MSNIFDIDAPSITSRVEAPVKRSKHRESLSASDVSKGKRRLADMVQLAFDTLEDATQNADYPTAIKAAQIILDRSGFGPRTTMDVNTTSVDLSSLTREELANRASAIAGVLRAAAERKQVAQTVN